MKILSYPELQTEKGIRFSRQWIHRLVREKKFPVPVRLGAASVGFVEDEVDAWLDERIKARATEHAAA